MSDDVDWPLYTKDQPQYFLFNADKGGLGKGPRATACAFWNDFLPKLQENSGSEHFIAFLGIVNIAFFKSGSGETPCEAGIVGAVSSHSPIMHRPVISTYISAVLLLAYQTGKKAIEG